MNRNSPTYTPPPASSTNASPLIYSASSFPPTYICYYLILSRHHGHMLLSVRLVTPGFNLNPNSNAGFIDLEYIPSRSTSPSSYPALTMSLDGMNLANFPPNTGRRRIILCGKRFGARLRRFTFKAPALPPLEGLICLSSHIE
jgi:hypothetical protein